MGLVSTGGTEAGELSPASLDGPEFLLGIAKGVFSPGFAEGRVGRFGGSLSSFCSPERDSTSLLIFSTEMNRV